ncbi:MAG: hypothetical protein HQM09_05230 [Candidatus Riflebacteria bacterium]|nr:hypothetical protein [Candidatus Riflebacteria bacterium]
MKTTMRHSNNSNPINRKSGSVILFTVVGMAFIIGLTAMVTDIGWMYYNRARLQTAVNAGWKAGYDRMMELGFPLDADKKSLIIQRVREMIAQNGYAENELDNFKVDFPNDKTLRVADSKNVDLFFARIMDMNSASVGAARDDLAGNNPPGGVIPVAIPFGVVKDLSENTYSVDFFVASDPRSGFVEGSEYILKPGNGSTSESSTVPAVEPAPVSKTAISSETIPASGAISAGETGIASLTINASETIIASLTVIASETGITSLAVSNSETAIASVAAIETTIASATASQTSIASVTVSDNTTIIASSTIHATEAIVSSGKPKNTFGVIAPDNINAGGTNDYSHNFRYGFNKPIQLGDRIMIESESLSGPTDQAVKLRIYGDSSASPTSRVIVPITDIGGEIAVNKPGNAAALSIYDLQGKDHPNGVYDPASYSFVASVRVIGFAEFELIPPTSYTRTGSNIVSGDAGSLGNARPGQVRGKFIRYVVRPGELPVR